MAKVQWSRTVSEQLTHQIYLFTAGLLQIETAIRFEKPELDIESIRLLAWETRSRLMVLLALVHAFLFSPFHPNTTCCAPGCWILGVTEPESGTTLLRLRFTVYVWPLARAGSLFGLFVPWITLVYIR